jgi:hypothetical protein
MNDGQRSPRDAAIDAVPPERRERLLTKASDMGVTRVDDVLWGLVKSVVDVEAASERAVAALAAMKDAENTIPHAVLGSVQRAGEDLSATISTKLQNSMIEVGQAIFQSIELAEKRGAEAIQAAATDLDKAAKAKGAAYIDQWKAAVAKATDTQVQAALKKAIGVRWSAVAMSLAAALTIGAGIGALLSQTASPTLAEVGARVVGRQVVFTGARGAVWCRPGVLCVKPRGFAPPTIFGISISVP